MRILFILKKNETYSFTHYCRRSSGLWNSTRYIVESLSARGVHAHIVEVNDNNDIDRELTLHRPDIVVIEALWVVPEKFDILMQLHPNVQTWSVHMHSHMPFLALEGIAMDWLKLYAERGIKIIANSPPSYFAYRCIFAEDQVVYLPNVYISHPQKVHFKDKEHIDIACFGAVRPLKNQLLQALCAIKFARDKGKKLNFHINGSRVETGGDPVLKNLLYLFHREDNADLILHDWHEPEDLIKVLSHFDMGMQVSLTETFNVVTADYVTAGLPVVVSKEIKWVSNWCNAEDDDPNNIMKVMHRVWHGNLLVKRNQSLLLRYSEKAQEMWHKWINE